MWMLAYFTALQWVRTPAVRRELKYLDEVMAKQFAELKLGATEKVIAFLQEQEPGLTVQEAEAKRDELLDDLRSGRFGFESTPHREIASMFLGLNEAAIALYTRCDWTVVFFDEPDRLCLPDTGITRFDPKPRVPGSGSGFIGTPTVETALHLSPSAALVITPGPGDIGAIDGDKRLADDYNLRAYAISERCVYGASQPHVVAAHRLAKQNPQLIVERRRRPQTLWFSDEEHEDGSVTFVGYSVDGVRRERFSIAPGAEEGQPHVSAEDLW
ncbi:MAG TPA: hypothetical protein VGH82_17275 [Gaiellaceae bacterium]|jgi:hypothetical protein